MSDNVVPITELYVLDEDGITYKRIDPSTVALAVEDETSKRTVQKFIDDGLKDWNEIKQGNEYVTASLLRETFDNIEDTLDVLDKNSVRYLDVWDATGQVDFSSIELPVKKGYSYKVIGEETSFGTRTYKPGDLIIFNRAIEKDEIVTEEDVDLLLGFGNEGTKIYRYVADVVPTYENLLSYENPVNESIIVVANDETHNNLLSFYEYTQGYDYVVDTYEDLLRINKNVYVPNYEFTINDSREIITLNRYIGDVVNVPEPYIVYASPYNIVKVISDETHDNKTTFYKWENDTWVYLEHPEYTWIYMFSRKEITDGIFRVKGTVPSYNDLPSTGQAIGDVWNVEDTGANYCWTEEGWDKLSETIDLSNYYTKEEVDELIDEKDSLPDQTGHAGEFLTTNGETASWQEITSVIYWADENTTFDEVSEAFNSNKLIMRKYNGFDFRLTSLGTKGLNPTPHKFTASSDINNILLTLDENNLWVYSNKVIDSLPDQSGQNGKILYTNGNTPYWDENPPAVIWKKWN